MKYVLKRLGFLSTSLAALLMCLVHGESTANTARRASGAYTAIQSTNLFRASGSAAIRLREEGGSGRARVAGLAGVRITFTRLSGTGAAPPSVQTDANGNWSQSGFVGFEGQTQILYRATPSKEGFSFDPALITFRGNKLLRPVTGLNFEARQDFATASGSVLTQNGRPVPEVTIFIGPPGGQARTTMTDNQGRWRFTLPNNSSTLRARAALQNFTFSPRFRDFTKSSASQLDFRLPDTFGIGGTLKSDVQGTAPPAPNAMVSFELISGTGARPASVRADANGDFRQTGFTTGCTYRVKVVNGSGRVCATLEVNGERAGGRINCL